MEEHEHTPDCYTRVLICGQEESEGHHHTEECYDADGNLICGQEESEGHQHTDECYEMQLTCGKEVHVHSEACYKHEEPETAETSSGAATEEASAGETEGAPTGVTEGTAAGTTTGSTQSGAAGTTEAAAAATTQKAADIAEPEKLKEIRFERLLTGRTGIYYIPENGGSDDWEKLDDSTKLDPEQDVILHIAFEIPAGKLNATNAKTEYELPLSISMTEDEVDDINKYESRVFIGTDREADDLGNAGSFEIEEEYNGNGDVTERKAVITFNSDTCTKVGGEKRTDGTVTVKPETIEGFLEMTISAEDLLTLKTAGEAEYTLEWNDDGSLDTTVAFDAEKLQAYLDEKNGKDEEAASEATTEESAAAATTEEIAQAEEEKAAAEENATEEEAKAEEAEPVQEEAPAAAYASGKLDYDGGSYTVTASFDESAKLPEGVQLSVKELTGASYQKYLSEANEAVGENKEVTGGRFFDITFTDANGKPVEPQGMVDVRINYKNTETIEQGTNVEGVHFTDQGAQTIDVDAKGVAENTVDVVGFQSDSFSVYGVVYTVDFEYTYPATGETYYYSIDGGTSINLTELLVLLGIKTEENVEEFVANQVENVEFSDPELVKVTHNGKFLGLFGKDDWKLESLQPFDTEETLTISLKNGEKIVVKVTDAASSNLADMLTTVTVTGAEQQQDGTYKVEAGKNYSVHLQFEENDTTTFPRTGAMTYQFPAGIKITSQITGTIVPSDPHLASIYSIDYVVDTNGLATFTWDVKEGKQSEFDALTGGTIGFDLNAQFDENATRIDWNGKGTYVVDHTKDINVSSKDAWYDKNDGKVHYRITVESKGDNSNVVLKDTFVSGAAVSLDQTSIHETTSPSHNISYSNVSGSGFTATIPQMKNGDKVTIEYTASIDYDKLIQKEGKKNAYGTYDTTGNKVEFTGTDDNPDNDSKEKGVDNAISYSSATKKATPGAYEDGKRTEEWEINANSEHKATITYITDTMKNGADKMEYSGNGITVDVYDANGDYLTTYTKSWSEMGVTTSSKSWRHDIPNEYRGEGYSYIVKYKTAVDVGDSTSSINVSNEVETDYGKGGASGNVEPRPGQKFDFDKKVSNLDIPGGTVTWDITIDVPETGLDDCTVYDYLPRVEGTLGTFFDKYDSYTVDGLIDGEDIVTSEIKTTRTIDGEDVEFTDAVVFTFKKGDSNGLYPVDGGRQVVLHVVTKLDENWLNTDPGDDAKYYLTHTNTAKLNNVEKKASVTIDNTEPNAIKKVYSNFEGNFHWNGQYGGVNDLDGWGYSVYFYGLNDETIDGDTFTFTDKFDDRYLKFEQDYYEQWADAQAHGSDVCTNNGNIQKFHRVVSYYIASENRWYESDQKVDASVNGDTITFSISKADIPKDSNGNYYPQYFISYVLRVKDKATVEKMKEDAKAAGGVLKINNTAVWAGTEPTSTEVEYEVPVIDKSYETVGDPKTGNYKFELKINETAEKLGDTEYLTVSDTVSNLTVDYSSLEFDPEDAVVAYNHSGNTMTFTVKNKTAVIIRYNASALATGHFSNTLEMNGESVTQGGDANIEARGTSSFDTPLHIKVLKHVYGNMMEVLPNVHFIVYEYSETAENHYGTMLGEYTTEADGMFEIEVPHIAGNKLLSKKYIIHEVEPPTGFERLPHDYVFTINKETASYGEYVYIDNDTMPIANTPVHEDELTINVVKNWSGTAEGEDLPDVTIRLYAKDSKLAEKSTGVEVESYTLTEKDLNPDTGKWEHSFEHLDSTKTYYIVEDPIPGYKATYTSENTLGLDRSGEIGVTNTKQKIHVEKVWEGGSAPETMKGLNINVMKDGTFYKSYTIFPDSSTGKWELDIDDLEFPGNFTVEEEGISGWTIKSIVYTQDGNNVTALTGSGNATITNQPSTTPQEESLKVEKKWYGGDGTTELTEAEKRELSANVELVRYRKELNGTQVHFVKFGSNTELASVFVKSNSTVSVNIDSVDGDDDVYFLADSPSNYQYAWQVQQANKDDISTKQRITTSTASISFNSGGYSDIYVVISGYGSINNMTVSVPADSQPEGGSAEAEIDPDYKSPDVATLNYANSWNAVFMNLPTIGEGSDGKKYSYTYGLRERSVTGGFELIGYTSNGTEIPMNPEEGYEDVTEEIQAGSSVTVKNKVKTTDVEITKQWEGLDDVTVYNTQGGTQPILQNNLRIFVELQRFFPDGTQDTSFDGREYIGSMYGFSRDSIGEGVNGHETTEATSETSTNEWKAVWENLPGAGKNSAGEYVEYTYKVKETSVCLNNGVDPSNPFAVANGNVYTDVGQPGESKYRSIKNMFTSTVAEDGKTIINTYTPTSIRVDKKWRYEDDESWPEDVASVTVQLFAQKQGGEKTAIKKDANTYWTLEITKHSRQIERTFENLPAKDIDGNDITYTVEETKMTMTDGTVVEVSDGTIGEWVVTNGEISEGVAEIINTHESAGALKITKAVTLNKGEMPQGDGRADGTYTFEIWQGDSQVATDKDNQPIGNLTITINGGVAQYPEGADGLIVNNLAPGIYTIKETASTNDGVTMDSEKTVTVTASKTISTEATAAFTNDYETTDFEFEKEWHGNDGTTIAEWPENVESIEVTVERRIGEETERIGVYTINKNGTNTSDPATAPELVKTSAEGYKYKLTDLPNKGSIGNATGEYTYYVRETKVVGYKDPIYANPSSGATEDGTTGNTTVTTPTEAFNGGKIINTPEEAYDLPHTGGFGTTPFYTIGLLLIAFAAGLYTYLNRKNLIAIRSDRRGSGAGRGKNRKRGGDGL